MRCRRCNRLLKNPDAVRLGIGPVCAKKEKAEREYEAQSSQDFLEGDYGDDVVMRLFDGHAATNVLHAWVYHSPTGFAWGYGGSGPSDLALNILLKYGLSRSEAFLFHHLFKEQFIAAMPREGGTIKGESIRSWIKAYTQKEAV